MSIQQGICLSYKKEILEGVHSSTHDYYIALYSSLTTLNKNTTSYIGTTNEIPESGTNYTTGGKALSGLYTNIVGDTAILSFSVNPQWEEAKFVTRGALIYNNSLPNKNAVAILDFGMDMVCDNVSLVIPFPTLGDDASLIKIT